ncbi:MAG: hypothetical protein M1832_005784 [Thelocarpon impressellum]|nr:MAG: hypothetical protein M1832_005784 [Thelocarpon impressellum]
MQSASKPTTRPGPAKAATPKKPAFGGRGTERSPKKGQDTEVFDVPSSDEDMDGLRANTKRPVRARSKPSPSSTVNFANGLPSPANDTKSTLREQPVTSAATGRRIPSRKRKADAAPIGDASPVQYDDDALQRHIALQSILDIDGDTTVKRSNLCSAFQDDEAPKTAREAKKSSTSSDRSANGLVSKKQIPQKPQTMQVVIEPAPARKERSIPKPLRSPDGPAAKDKSPRKRRKSPTSPENVPQAPIAKQVTGLKVAVSRAPPKRRDRALPSHQRTPPRQAFETPPKDPASASGRASSAATTPRQTHLWSALLGDGENEAVDSPSYIPVQRLSITQDEAIRVAPSGLTPEDNPKTGPARRRRQQAGVPKKRLIDSLEDELKARNMAVESDGEAEDDLRLLPQSTVEPRIEDQPSAPSPSQLSLPRSDSQSQFKSSQGPSQVQGGGPKITYARDRSYLTEGVVDEASMFNTPLDVGLGSQGRRRGVPNAALLSQALGAVDEEHDVVDGASSGAIRSIHELRQAGGNKRFLDESEALFEDIEYRAGTSLSRRRNGVLELGNKMSQKSYARQFLDQGLDRRLFRDLHDEQDVITGFALASIIAFLAQEVVGGSVLLRARQEGAVTMLTRLVGETRSVSSIVKDRSSNMSKAARAMAVGFANMVRGSSIWTSEEPDMMTPRLVALRSLEMIVTRSRDAGDKSSVVSRDSAEKLIQVLRLDDAEDEDEDDGPSSQDVMEIELALAILESSTINVRAGERGAIRDDLSTSAISDFLLSVSRRPRDRFKTCQVLVVRLILNVSNNNPPACDALGSQEVVKSLVHVVTSEFGFLGGPLEEEERRSSVDHLILVLAAMINFAEWSEAARSHVLSRDGEEGPLLDGLVRFFLHGLELAGEADSVEETHLNVAYGYLAVLLGNLCLHAGVKQHVRTKLPGGTLRSLSAAVREFLHYHMKVDDQLHASQGEESPQDGFTERLQAVVDSLDAA